MSRHTIRQSAKRILPRRGIAALRRGLQATQIIRAMNRRGWFGSVVSGRPQDGNGNPLPWFTYPSIDFLRERVPADAKVFEYGMGASTLWWSKIAGKVCSVEHHKGWFDTISVHLPENVSPELCDLRTEEYVNAVERPSESFDIIVIDGRRRVECARRCPNALSERGVIVWDNSERQGYNEGHAFLRSKGFRRIEFYGFGPVAGHEWCTSIFYRENNCLGI